MKNTICLPTMPAVLLSFLAGRKLQIEMSLGEVAEARVKPLDSISYVVDC